MSTTTHEQKRKQETQRGPAIIWIPGVVAMVLLGARLAMQSELTLWTSLSRQFYAEGPLGWELTTQSWPWLGLDVLALTIGVTLAALVLNRVSKRASGERLRSLGVVGARLSMVGGVAAALFAVWSLSAGLPDAGMRGQLPVMSGASADALEGDLSVGAAGRYVIVENERNLIVARISAGGDTFEGRFTQPQGALTFDPRDILASPSLVDIRVPVEHVSTGIGARDGSARGYFEASTYPELILDGVKVSTRLVEPSGSVVSFEGEASLKFMGTQVSVPLKGRLSFLDEAARASLSLEDSNAAFFLEASFEIDITATPLKGVESAFDNPLIPVQVGLVIQLDDDSV